MIFEKTLKVRKFNVYIFQKHIIYKAETIKLFTFTNTKMSKKNIEFVNILQK